MILTPQKPIVVGQQVTPAKVARARELRSSATFEERILWEHLRAHRLRGLHFRRQQVIDGFIVDFYCHSERLVIEVDGEVHEAQTEYDAERDTILRARGLRMLRFTNSEVRECLPAVIDRIVGICAADR